MWKGEPQFWLMWLLLFVGVPILVVLLFPLFQWLRHH